jgi:hypothetical protein
VSRRRIEIRNIRYNVIGAASGSSGNVGKAKCEIVPQLKSSFQGNQSSRINICGNKPSRDGVDRLDDFLHGIAHSGYLQQAHKASSQKTEDVAVSNDTKAKGVATKGDLADWKTRIGEDVQMEQNKVSRFWC